MVRKVKAFFLTTLLVVGSLFQIACKESIEKSIATFTRSVKAARQITTVQHTHGHITDSEYKKRLLLFQKVYTATDKLGDELVRFGEINETNKLEILALVRSLNAAVIDVVNTGNLGIKNDKSKAEFTRWLLVASATASSIEVAIAAVKKPMPTNNIKIEKIEEVK